MVTDPFEKKVVKETASSFSQKVTELVWKDDVSYFDAITTLMKELDLEPEYVAKLITPELKSEMAIELEKTNLIRKSTTTRLV